MSTLIITLIGLKVPQGWFGTSHTHQCLRLLLALSSSSVCYQLYSSLG